MNFRIFILLAILCVAQIGRAQFSYVGSATSLGPNSYLVTPNTSSQIGAMWNSSKVNLNTSFDLIFDIFLGANDLGADGMTFTLQPISTSMGGGGIGMGAGGIVPSVIIEYDTYQNPGDPAYDHIAISKNGDVVHSTANLLAGPVSANPLFLNIENNNYHTSRIKWDANKKTLEVYFDCAFRVKYTGDIINNIFSGDPNVFWGFSGATGGLANEQKVRNIYFNQSPDVTICEGDSTQFSLAGADTYIWLPATNISSTAVGNPKVYPKISTQYTVTASSACLGNWKDTIMVNVSSKPFVNLGADQSICIGGSPVTFDAGVIAGATYLWSNSSTSQSISTAAAGQYIVEVSKSLCKVKDTVNLAVSASLIVNLGNDKEICAGDPAVTFDAGLTNVTYAWNTGSTQKTISTSAAGIYSIEVNKNGCVGKDSVQLTVNTLPVVNLGLDKNICKGDSALLFNAANPGASFLWSSGETNASISKNSAGNYSVKVTNNKGCVGKDTVALIVNNLPSFSLGADINICKNANPVSISAGAWSAYLWDNGSTNSSLVTNTEGLHWAQITDSYGCKKRDSLMLTKINNTKIDILGDSMLCLGKNTTLKVQASAAVKSYLWSTNEKSATIKVQNKGLYSVAITDVNNCSATDTFVVSLYPSPLFQVNDLEYCFAGDSITVSAPASHYNWEWSNKDQNSTTQFYQEGTYFLKGSNEFQCSSTATFKISSNCSSEIFVPNTFTPNNDTYNDVFYCVNSGIENFQILIFNRWGEEIFSSNDSHFEWNGTYHSLQCENDVYVYKLNYSAYSNGIKKKVEKIGSIALLR